MHAAALATEPTLRYLTSLSLSAYICILYIPCIHVYAQLLICCLLICAFMRAAALTSEPFCLYSLYFGCLFLCFHLHFVFKLFVYVFICNH